MNTTITKVAKIGVLLGTTLIVHRLLEVFLFPSGWWNNATLQFSISLAGNVVAAYVFVWLVGSVNDQRGPQTVPDDRAPATWSVGVAIAILTTFSLLAAYISQAFISAFWLHANELRSENLISEAGLKRIGFHFLGLVPTMIWAPFITYASLSVGRRLRVPPKFSHAFAASAISISLIALWNFLDDLASDAMAPVWRVLPRLPGDTTLLRSYDNAAGYIIQIGGLIGIAAIYAIWIKTWCQVGWWLKNRGIA